MSAPACPSPARRAWPWHIFWGQSEIEISTTHIFATVFSLPYLVPVGLTRLAHPCWEKHTSAVQGASLMGRCDTTPELVWKHVGATRMGQFPAWYSRQGSASHHQASYVMARDAYAYLVLEVGCCLALGAWRRLVPIRRNRLSYQCVFS